jgi:hypothetical protein
MRRARAPRTASAGSVRPDLRPGSGTSHRRTARPRAGADRGTARRRHGPCRRTADPWRAFRHAGDGARSPNARQTRCTADCVSPTSTAIERSSSASRRWRGVQRVDDHLLDLRIVTVRGRPGRGSSLRPSRRSDANRLRHPAPSRRSPRGAARSRCSSGRQMPPARSASAAPAPARWGGRRDQPSHCSRSSRASSICAATGYGIPAPHHSHLQTHQGVRTLASSG